MRGGPSIAGRCIRTLDVARRPSVVSDGGFTVMEVIIVLAITGGLFVSAVLMIAGRQNQTAFDQSIRQVQSQIQQVLNEVSTGFYPNRSDFRCTPGGAGAPPSLTAIATAQGTNSGCIFLGKAIQFKVAGTDPERFAMYTITGLKDFGACATEPACLALARPILVAPSSPSHNAPGYPDNSTEEQLQNGLTTARAWYRNGAGYVDIGAIAFMSSLAEYGSGGGLVSGSNHVNIVAIDSTSLGSSKLDLAEALNSDGGNRLATGTINPAGGVFICFESGGTEDYAIVQIGGEGRDLSVTLHVKDKTGTPCTYP